MPPKGWLRRVTAALGPGVITGAADDDPSGVATYSIVGAQFGTGLLWTACQRGQGPLPGSRCSCF